jgi:hypothetical protein
LASPISATRIVWSLDVSSPDPQLQTAEVTNGDDLDRTLDAIADQATEPVIIELISSTGERLGVGLGAAGSVLSFTGTSDPPYFISTGNLGPQNDGVVFYLHGHWSEFPASALVTNQDAREAARRFVATGRRPDNVRWEDV